MKGLFVLALICGIITGYSPHSYGWSHSEHQKNTSGAPAYGVVKILAGDYVASEMLEEDFKQHGYCQREAGIRKQTVLRWWDGAVAEGDYGDVGSTALHIRGNPRQARIIGACWTDENGVPIGSSYPAISVEVEFQDAGDGKFKPIVKLGNFQAAKITVNQDNPEFWEEGDFQLSGEAGPASIHEVKAAIMDEAFTPKSLTLGNTLEGPQASSFWDVTFSQPLIPQPVSVSGLDTISVPPAATAISGHALAVNYGETISSSETALGDKVMTLGQSLVVVINLGNGNYEFFNFEIPLACFCGEADGGILDIGDASAKIGEEVEIAVRVQGAPNPILSFGLDVIFNPRVLKYLDYSEATTSGSFEDIDVNMKGNGRLRIGGYDPKAKAIEEGYDGDIVLLKFKVLGGEENWSYPVLVEELKDDMADWPSTGGCLTILSACDGDLNGDGGITPSDALDAFKCYLGSGECGYCFDVNKSGEITPADALCIFQTYLGLPSCLNVMVEVPPPLGVHDAPALTMTVSNLYSVAKPIVTNMTIAGARLDGINNIFDAIGINKVITEANAKALDQSMIEAADSAYNAFTAALEEAQALADSGGKKGNVQAVIYFENTVRTYQTKVTQIQKQLDSIEAKVKAGTIKLDKALLQQMTPIEIQEFKGFLAPAARDIMINTYPAIFKVSSVDLYLNQAQQMAHSVMAFCEFLPEQMGNFWIGEAEATLAKPCIPLCAAQNWGGCAACILASAPAAIDAYNNFKKKWNGCKGWWFKKWACRSYHLANFIYLLY